jgi:hypothetical protein
MRIKKKNKEDKTTTTTKKKNKEAIITPLAYRQESHTQPMEG